VVLTATSGDLEGAATGTVVIYAASFTSSSPDWLGQTTVFTNTTRATDATDYLWSFGDELTSTLENPARVYADPDVYTIILTATNVEGSGVATGSVTIYSAPAVDFTGSPTQGVVPLNVSFTSIVTTTPPRDPTLAYLWRFGDLETSALRDPVHTYASTGTYTVTLQVSNAAGSAVEIKERHITVREAGVAYHVYLPLVLHQRR
jgi:PKD repeat protein